MLGYLDFMFLSYSGRIGRLAFWGASLLLGILNVVACGLLLYAARDVFVAIHNHEAVSQNEFTMRIFVPTMIVFVLFLYPSYAIYTKRWHDRNKSGWWSLIAFLPIIGGLWMTIELGFLGGTEGGNSYGMR